MRLGRFHVWGAYSWVHPAPVHTRVPWFTPPGQGFTLENKSVPTSAPLRILQLPRALLLAASSCIACIPSGILAYRPHLMLQQALLCAWQPGRCRLLLSLASHSSHAPAGGGESSGSSRYNGCHLLGGALLRILTTTDASVPSCSRPHPVFPQNQRGACSSAAGGEATSTEQQQQRASVVTPAPSTGASTATSADPHFIGGGSATAAAAATAASATARLGFVRGGFSVADFPPELIRNFCIIAHVDHGEWGN